MRFIYRLYYKSKVVKIKLCKEFYKEKGELIMEVQIVSYINHKVHSTNAYVFNKKQKGT